MAALTRPYTVLACLQKNPSISSHLLQTLEKDGTRFQQPRHIRPSLEPKLKKALVPPPARPHRTSYYFQLALVSSSSSSLSPPPSPSAFSPTSFHSTASFLRGAFRSGLGLALGGSRHYRIHPSTPPAWPDCRAVPEPACCTSSSNPANLRRGKARGEKNRNQI